MTELKIGDIVGRKSYGCDIAFKVHDIQERKDGKRNYILKGMDYRILADSPGTDLEHLSSEESDKKREEANKWINRRSKNKKTRKQRGFLKGTKKGMRGVETFQKLGKILHIDGANDFISKCKENYDGLGLESVVLQVPEQEQPSKVISLLQQHKPDILVLTGHDGMIKGNQDFINIQNYRNSIYFVNAVKEARKYEKSLDNLVIFAGACQSDYEAILSAGANYASSPKRVLIHMLDPVVVAGRVALTGIGEIISISDAVGNTKTQFEGIGGLQTRGKTRIGAPKSIY